MGQDAAKKSDRLRGAETVLGAATQLRDQREKAAGEIADQLEAARGEVEALDALEKLTAEQHLASENARKRAKRLAAELEEGRGRVEEAEAAAEAAQRAVDVAQLADLDAELQERDAALVWEMAD